MATRNRSHVRHDRGSIRHLTPVVPGIVLALEWSNGLSSWFRSLWSAARRAVLRETVRWFLGTGRLQPIHVVAAAQHAATHLRSRGHFTRI